MLHFKGKSLFKCKRCGQKFESFDTEGGIIAGPNLPPCPKCGSSETRKATILEKTINYMMTGKESKEAVYNGVIKLAVSLKRNNQTMTMAELTQLLNESYPDFEHPYGNHGIIQAAFKRAKTQEAKDALVSVFTSENGNPIWKEE